MPLEHRNDSARLSTIRAEVREMAERFPLYEYLRG